MDSFYPSSQPAYSTMGWGMNPGTMNMALQNPCCVPEPCCVVPEPRTCGCRHEHRREPETQLYIVRKGDSVYKIAQRFGTTVNAIVRLNNLQNPNLIYPGQRLLIPKTR